MIIAPVNAPATDERVPRCARSDAPANAPIVAAVATWLPVILELMAASRDPVTLAL